MTATSADHGSSAGNSGDRGWFTPAGRDPAYREPRPQDRSGSRGDDHPPRASGARSTQPSETEEPTHRTPPAASGTQTPRALPAPIGVAPEAGTDWEGQLSRDAVLIRRTLAEVEPIADEALSYFYALLFLRHPQLRELFPVAMDVQRDRLFRALLTSARLIDDEEVLTKYAATLGRGHRKYGTRPEHYPAVGECLIAALARYATTSWSRETEAAWVRAYTAVSQLMIDAAAEDERAAPAWWQAEIVAHEPRTADVAVLTLRPDRPYPFLAGQYTEVETPWWPRVWRHYSLASCPRPDGLISFHVRAIPAGWVSNALVHRARPGDVLRLGPASGSMTVDHAADGDLLCLGGGTGIAPIKALVEEVVQHGRPRRVEVFYGARADHDLYDLDALLRLADRHPGVAVRPVVAGGPSSRPVGQLPQVVVRFGPWPGFEGYLSGPPGMIRNGVDALMRAGIPLHRIRHDLPDRVVGAGG